MEGDTLGPNLKQLHGAGSSHSLQPILQLQQLRVLHLGCDMAFVTQLQQLTCLQHLERLELNPHPILVSHGQFEQFAAATACLPAKEVRFRLVADRFGDPAAPLSAAALSSLAGWHHAKP